MRTQQRKLGDYGEQLAAQYLTARGYAIVDRNWHCVGGELDIVAREGGEWVFVEVRTRRAPDTNSALESVTETKQARIIAAAEAYLEAHQLVETPWRVDLVVIALTQSGPRIEVIRNAVGW